MNTTFNLLLDNTTHLTVEKTPITSKISNKNNAQITQDNNYYDISDPQSHQATFKRLAPEFMWIEHVPVIAILPYLNLPYTRVR